MRVFTTFHKTQSETHKAATIRILLREFCRGAAKLTVMTTFKHSKWRRCLRYNQTRRFLWRENCWKAPRENNPQAHNTSDVRVMLKH